MLRAEKAGQIFRGTAEEIREEIAAFERRDAENEEAKRRVREQEQREQLDRLVNRVYALARECLNAHEQYEARGARQERVNSAHRARRPAPSRHSAGA